MNKFLLILLITIFSYVSFSETIILVDDDPFAESDPSELEDAKKKEIEEEYISVEEVPIFDQIKKPQKYIAEADEVIKGLKAESFRERKKAKGDSIAFQKTHFYPLRIHRTEFTLWNILPRKYMPTDSPQFEVHYLIRLLVGNSS